jgi:hypothetical protein
MSQIMHGLARWELPQMETVLDYLSNMAYTLELMLKLHSGNWRTHEVHNMYEEIFGQPHPNEDFMDYLKVALTDQKYLFAPASDSTAPTDGTIAHYIPEMESLFDDLLLKMREQHRQFGILKKIKLPLTFGEFLRDNPGRFFKAETHHDELTQELGEQAIARHEQQVQSAASNIDLYLRLNKGVFVFQGEFSSVYALR